MALIIGNTALLAMTTAGEHRCPLLPGSAGGLWVQSGGGAPPPSTRRPPPGAHPAGMSAARQARLGAASNVFTFVFAAECGLKLLGYGVAGFLGDGMNVFDALVVVVSLADTFASVSERPLPLLPSSLP